VRCRWSAYFCARACARSNPRSHARPPRALSPAGRRRAPAAAAADDDGERREGGGAPPGKRMRHDEGGEGASASASAAGASAASAAASAQGRRGAPSAAAAAAAAADDGVSGGGGGEHDEAGASQVVDEADDTVYCLCQQTSYGEMIGCDNDDCPYEWFHLPCVGLTLGTRPRGKFFCPNCRFYEGALDREGDFRRMSANPPSRVAPQHQRPRGGGAR
jgi:inhibitor of growth protein 3